jgi:hypothetical protein
MVITTAMFVFSKEEVVNMRNLVSETQRLLTTLVAIRHLEPTGAKMAQVTEDVHRAVAGLAILENKLRLSPDTPGVFASEAEA